MVWVPDGACILSEVKTPLLTEADHLAPSCNIGIASDLLQQLVNSVVSYYISTVETVALAATVMVGSLTINIITVFQYLLYLSSVMLHP
jgi:hypothetical protein